MDKAHRPELREKIAEIAWAFLEGVASTLSKGEPLDFEKLSKMVASQILALEPQGEPPLLSDEQVAQILYNTPGTKLKFESKLTDQDMRAFKDEMKIELMAVRQAQRNSDIKFYGGK